MRRSQGKKSGAARETDERRRSTGSFFHSSGKDDDLDLFKEVQTKGRENFLLRPIDDIDEALSTNYGPYSESMGGFLPSRGVGSDLLNGEGDKSDYDWLLTPPETPLFRSLDDEMPPAREGPRTSTISNIEKNKRNNRNSSSPYLSRSPLHHGKTIEERARRLSLSPQSFSTNKAGVTPSWRPHTPSTNHSSSVPRTSTTSFRMSKRSRSSVGSPKAGGASSNIRGNSLSPKSRAWSSNLHGFSSGSPRNLRISGDDPPACSMECSSPASNINKHCISPITSASIASLSSHERDHLTSHSRDSEALSAADDLAYSQSISMDLSERPSSTRVSSIRHSIYTSSKKLSKTSTSCPSPHGSSVVHDDTARESHDDARIPGCNHDNLEASSLFPSVTMESTEVTNSVSGIVDASIEVGCENVLAKCSSATAQHGKRNLTLEEATEAILFCNSIARDLAYQAATVAVDRETFCQCEGSRSTLPLGEYSNSSLDITPSCSKRSRRWLLRPLRSWKKKVDTEAKITPDNRNTQSSTEHLPQDFGVVRSDKINGWMPLELECRCSCSVM